MQSERLISRRDVLKAGVLLGAAFTLEACGIASNPKPTGTETGTVPTTEETEKSLPDQAREKVLGVLTGAMKPQAGLRTEDNGQLSHYFKSDSNLDAWTPEVSKVITNGKSSVVLKGSFIDASVSGGEFATAEKTTEEFELNNISVSVKQDLTPTLSDADKANGITWKGYVAIDFIDRYRANLYEIGGSLGVDRQRVESFVMSEETQYPNFSSWIQNELLFSAQLTNDEWKIDLPSSKGNLTSPNMAELFSTNICFGDVPNCVVNKFVDNP